MTVEEFNKRCHEVFIAPEEEEFFKISVQDGVARIIMCENETPFTYVADMTERPEALQYLLGNRDNFND